MGLLCRWCCLSLYIKDVHAILNQECKLLKELVLMFPGCKWMIVGGSPCQDLTFAGPFHGLLGLTGPSSRLFFVLLCVIHCMQTLVGTTAVRFLVENAGSMLKCHSGSFLSAPRAPSFLFYQVSMGPYPIWLSNHKKKEFLPQSR